MASHEVEFCLLLDYFEALEKEPLGLLLDSEVDLGLRGRGYVDVLENEVQQLLFSEV